MDIEEQYIERLSSISGEAITRIVVELQCLDFKKLKIDDVLPYYSELMKAYIAFPISIESGRCIYRSRKHRIEEKGMFLARLSDILPGPTHTKLGRANRCREPVYYFSSDLDTTIHECKAGRDDQFTILECQIVPQSEPQLFSLGINPVRGDLPDAYERVKSRIANDPDLRHKYGLIDRFIKEEFLKDVPSGKDYLYKSTVAIAALAVQFGIGELRVDGIAYPSNAPFHESSNVAILPSAFSRICHPIACKRVTIAELRPGQRPMYSEEIMTNGLWGDGRIEWPAP